MSTSSEIPPPTPQPIPGREGWGLIDRGKDQFINEGEGDYYKHHSAKVSGSLKTNLNYCKCYF